MSIGPVEPVSGFAPLVPPVLTPAPETGPDLGAAGAVAGTGAAAGDFGRLLSQGLANLERVADRADQLAVQAATGDLSALHDYTITATEAAVTTQLTTAVRNRALEAFTEIMRMPI